MSEPGRVGTIFFDAAGTLLQVRGSVGEAYLRAARDSGTPIEGDSLVERIDRQFNLVLSRHEPMLFDPLPTSEEQESTERRWWRRVVDETFARVDPKATVSDHLFDAVYEYFGTGPSWVLEPGCRETLRALQDRGYRLGVISNFDSRLNSLLEQLEISQFFQSITISALVGLVKPDPAIFHLALATMGASPSDCMHIGDRLEDDFRGAGRVGIRAVLYDPSDLQPGVSPRLSRLDEVFDFLV